MTRNRGTIKDNVEHGKKSSQRAAACFHLYKPLLFASVAAMAASYNSLIVKLLPHVTLLKITLTRGLGTFLFNLPFLIHSTRIEGTFRISYLPNLLIRGLCGTAVVYCNFISWKLMPMADAGVIASTTPVWVIILSRIILKENLDLLNSLSVVFSMLGLVLMSRVFSLVFSSAGQKYSDQKYWYGFLSALLAAIFLAVSNVSLRKMKNVSNPLIVVFQSVILSVVSLIGIFVQSEWRLPKCGWDGPALVSLAILSFVAELLYSAAFKNEKAAAVSIVRTSGQVVFQFIFQVSIFNEIPDVYSVLATVCVLTSLCLSGLRKCRQEKRRLEAQRRCDDSTAQDETNL